MLSIFNSSDLDDLSGVLSPYVRGQTPGQIVGDLVTKYFLPGAGMVMFIYLILGGYEIMMSAGNPKSLASGKGKITNAIIGFVIIFAAYWIVQAVSIALGLKSIEEVF